MKLFTEVRVPDSSVRIGLDDRIMVVGSCFADSAGRRMSDAGFDVCANPFGPLYNPESIASSLERIASCELFSPEECVAVGGSDMICSFSHHTSFARRDTGTFLDDANSALCSAHDFWESCNRVVVTLGTASVWRRADTGAVVNNCLKRPGTEFMNGMLDVEEVVSCLRRISAAGEGKEFIFTVSPIRHLGSGAHVNTISKATLHLGLRDFLPQAGVPCDYFPSYEIVMDELRDYRFCAEDLCHPSPSAEEYVWEKFKDSCVVPEDLDAVADAEKESRRRRHVPMSLKFGGGR